jgi:PAS domain S-box-containing protein
MPEKYAATAGARVLICEDEMLFAEDMALTLKDSGYEIAGMVATGEEAVQTAEEARPDLILMDIKLAGEIDGIEAAERIRSKLDIPLIYLTAYTEKDVFKRAKHTEPYGYVGKPASMTQLISTIETALYKHHADRKVRESEARRAKAEELTGLHSWEWDVQTGLLFWSAESYRSFGWYQGRDRPTFDSFIESVHADDREMVRAVLMDSLDGKRPYDLEFRIVQPNGQERILHSRGEIQRDDNGRPLRMLGMALDITERKCAEEERKRLREQLFHAKKMEAIGALTGGIAHDFNNMLTIINGFAEMILLDITEDNPIYADIQAILQTGRKGAEIVQRLLAFTKKAEITVSPLDLNEVIRNSVALMERTFPKMIAIEMRLASDLGTVNGDRAQIEQALMNLCINAKDAMTDGGTLKIETENVTVDEAYCRRNLGATPGRHVLMAISDTGGGISKELMERVFDPFFTTKGWDSKKGTGLGLSVAKGIAEQHGGWIACESSCSKGTTFTLYFPVTEEFTAARESEAGTDPGEVRVKVLLVDDEDLVRDLGKRILERAGYGVITASNGKVALEIYAREQSSIGLVALDLIMPQMGGEKCLEELLKINPNVKVVVSTGGAMPKNERARLGACVKGFVNKPYQVRQFLDAVREALASE